MSCNWWRLFLLALSISCLVPACGKEKAQDVRLEMITTLGTIELELYAEQAPLTATNFLRLVDGGHFAGATFYRVVSPANDNGSPVISVIQGGIGDAASPLPPIAHEATATTGLRHLEGSLSMARGKVGTATTEFFICLGAQRALDYGGTRNNDGQGFAVFGRVIGGMNVVREIHAAPANADTDNEYLKGQLLEQPVVIRSVRRIR